MATVTINGETFGMSDEEFSEKVIGCIRNGCALRNGTEYMGRLKSRLTTIGVMPYNEEEITATCSCLIRNGIIKIEAFYIYEKSKRETYYDPILSVTAKK